MSRSSTLAAFVLLGALFFPVRALATDVNLFLPTWTPYELQGTVYTTVSLSTGTREAKIRANSTFSISAIGAMLDLKGNTSGVAVEVRASTASGTVSGALLYSTSRTISGNGIQKYTFPATFTFTSGDYYLLVLRSLGAPHAEFHTAGEWNGVLPYTIPGNYVTVLDGFAHGGAANTIIPRFSLDIDNYVLCSDTDTDGATAATCGGTDCDDNNPTVRPGATELCDGLDNNCDSVLPADELDSDGDLVLTCDGDCDDNNPTVHPGATELCDGLDNDCDTVLPAGELDNDGDLLFVCDGDCDDNDPHNFPGNAELCDGLDNDCDATADDGLPTFTWHADNDGDGYGDPATTAVDCAAPSGYLGDNTDCDDTTSALSPDETELCDGVDQNCNRLIDDGTSDVDSDGLCDALDACEGNNASGDLDNDGICNDLDPDAPENIPFLPWWALAALAGGLGRAGAKLSEQRGEA